MTRYGADDEMTDLLRKNTFYFVPVFNPDGYEYSFTTDRMWRKTRTAFNRSTFCTDIDGELMAARGADANRNWDVMWGGVGSSSNPCDLLYKGVHPESEPCVKLYADQLRWKQHQLKSYWSLHSFFEVLFSPNSYTDKRPHDDAVIQRVGRKTTLALKKRFGTPYVFSTSFDLNMPVTGGAIDYVHDKLNVSFAYVIELRPRSAPPGFLLDPSEIIPTALETLDGILAGVKEIDAILQQKNTKP
ncbi:zinc carboxypeptidase-like [Hydractinia symbiolongicarpus]|uniref:zinc carboxypeptidase-like n=1 Tax=Hydractinia symbiolongicarpus TaxID=13093 RepID=UPI002549C86F|nr:zinc carboxypeptidase-like [Hydractinia symbiolongicarpus]